MQIIGIQGCEKIKLPQDFTENIKQSSNYFKELEDALISCFANIRRQDLSGQEGRSMIEMLGVLSVIAVLSVAGLAGYSKAMERYRINETINQISHIVTNTRTLFKSQSDLYGGLSFSEQHMSITNNANRKLDGKAKIFPASLVKNNYKNLFGGDIDYFANCRFEINDGKAFILRFRDLPQEACIELATRDWQSGLGLLIMNVIGSTSDADVGNVTRTTVQNCVTQYINGAGRICAKDMPMSIEQAVATCNSDKNNYITFKFY